MEYKKVDREESIGTSNRGEMRADFHKLVDLFGDPYETDDGKTQFQWVIKFNDGTIATIYDWRIESDPTKNKDWTIGGSSVRALYYIVALVLKHYRPLIKRIFGDHE